MKDWLSVYPTLMSCAYIQGHLTCAYIQGLLTCAYIQGHLNRHTLPFKQTHPTLMTSVEIQKDVGIRNVIQKDTRHARLYIYTRHLNDAVHAVMPSVEIQEDVDIQTDIQKNIQKDTGHQSV